MKRMKFYLLGALFAFSCITNLVYASGEEFTVGQTSYAITAATYHKCEISAYMGEAETLTIPQTVRYGNSNYTITGIGFDAFNLNATITKVQLPSTIEYIASYAFSDCYNLASINLENVEIIGDNAFFNNQSLVRVVFGKKLTSVGAKAFLGCIGLKSAKFPHSVTSISESAFKGCENLEDVNLGAGVEIIGDSAFVFCSALQSVSCHATIPPQIAENTFDKEITKNILLYIPAGSKDAYVKSIWGEFFAFENIIEKGTAPTVSTKTTTMPVEREVTPRETGSIRVHQKGNVVSVTLPNGASIEVYDEDDVLLETVKMIDGTLYNE